MTRLISLYLLFSVTNLTYATDPIGGCRIKSSTFKDNLDLVSASGCVIMNKINGTIKFLLIYEQKNQTEKGWGFPGGKAATKSVDSAVDSKTGKPKSQFTFDAAKNVDFDYVEPSPCTAARETREETGLDVIIGDLIDAPGVFRPYHCYPMDKEALHKPLVPLDNEEALKAGWFTLEEMSSPNFLRFPDNLDIAKKALTDFQE